MTKTKEILIAAAEDLDYYDVADRPYPSIALINRLAEVNGNAAGFTTGPNEVLTLAIQTERLLERQGLPKGKRIGIEVIHRGAGPTAASYGYSVKATQVRLRRRSGGWYLVQASADRAYPRQGERREVRINETQADAIRKASMKAFTVRAAAPAEPAEPQLETA